MIPARIAGTTRVIGPPPNWNPATDGTCASLSVRIEGNRSISAWEPTPKEIEAINKGAKVRLTCIGVQPPVWLDISPGNTSDPEPMPSYHNVISMVQTLLMLHRTPDYPNKETVFSEAAKMIEVAGGASAFSYRDGA